MTEHSSVIFVFFFLAEYASIILMCILLTIIFLGGYDPLFPEFFYYIIHITYTLFQLTFILIDSLLNLITYGNSYFSYYINNEFFVFSKEDYYKLFSLDNEPLLKNVMYSTILAIKSCVLIFTFI
jgi:NADH-ubiquinone oxidoreductase chain 1